MTKIENVALCKVEDALSIISGKWKPAILLNLITHGTLRYGELKRQLDGITPKMLSSQLRELEMEGLVEREEFPEIPPKVMYTITDYGMTLEPILTTLHAWGVNHQTRTQ